MLLQGLDPSLTGYEAVLALYEREVGQKTRKGMPFFLKHLVLEKG